MPYKNLQDKLANNRSYRKRNLRRVRAWQRKSYRKHREERIAYLRTAYQKDPTKILARSAVQYALNVGNLRRPCKCQRCNKKRKLQAHHYLGYGIKNRAKVRWLCGWCHKVEDSI